MCINSLQGLNYIYQNKSYNKSNNKIKMPFFKEGGVLKGEKFTYTIIIYFFYLFPKGETSLNCIATPQFTPIILDAPPKPRPTTVNKSRP